MRKKEDLKKHFTGEKNVLKADNRINIPFLFFLILPGIIFPQVPLDGFCELSSFNIPAGYQRSVSADLDGDKNDEIILFSPNIKKIAILSALSSGDLRIQDYEIGYELSQVRFLKDLKRFACVSRKNRLVAVYEFEISDSPELISTINFDSYPENIFEADIDNDGKLEMLISGTGFDGISVLYSDKNRLAEKKILSGESFSNAVFIDLTNDTYPDIAAFNVLKNRIEFFYNNTRGRFRFERAINLTDKIDILGSTDIDSDGLQDLIFTKGTDLNILYGDFQSAYSEKKIVPLQFKPDFIIITHFNRDKIPDLAYLSTGSNTLNILFGRNGRTYFKEITYTNLSSPKHLQTFKSINRENLFITCADGNISTISTLDNNFRKVNLVPAVSAGFIRKFDLNNDNISDICFIDEADNSLKILLRDLKGIPSVYYQNQLAEAHQNVLVDDFYKLKKTFYCYSEGKQLIESLRFNFRTNKGILQQLYSPGKIIDVSIHRADSSLVYLYVLYEKLNKLYIGMFEHREQSIIFKEFPFIDRAVISARLFYDNGIGTFYWKGSSDFVFLNEARIKNGRSVYRGVTGLSRKDSTRISLFIPDNKGNSNSSLISLVNNDDESFLIKFNLYSYSIIRASDEYSKLNNSEDNQVHFAQINSSDEDRLFVYNPGSGSLSEIIFSHDGKTYSLNRILESSDINNYFIDKFRNEINYFVFSNRKTGSISIIPLKK